jgi:hypothetical protein
MTDCDKAETYGKGQAGRDIWKRTGWQRHEYNGKAGREMSDRAGWQRHDQQARLTET